MATNTIQVSILAETQRMRQGIDDANRQLTGFQKRADKVGSAFRSAFTLAAGAIAAAGVTTLIKDSVTAASDLNETISKTQQLFGSSAGSIVEWSKTTAASLGQSRQSALDAATTFATFGKAAGLSGDALVQFAQNNTKLASDLASFNNTSPEQAIEALGAAFRGEAEPMRQFGVLLDADSLKAEALAIGLLKPVKNMGKIKEAQTKVLLAQRKYNEALKKHGKNSDQALRADVSLSSAKRGLDKALEGTTGTLTQQQKVMAANSLIMKQTKDAQGDFGRTSGGLANQQRILTAQFENLKTQIGQGLLPVTLSIVKYLNANLMPTIKAVGTFIKENATAFMILGGVIGTVVAIAGTYLAVTKAITIATTAWTAVTKAYTAVQTALNFVMSMNPIGLVIIAIVGLVAALVIAYKKSETFRKAVDMAFNFAWSTIKKVFNWIKGNWPLLLAIITGPIGIAVRLVTKHWSSIKTGAVNAFNSIKNFVVGTFNAINSKVYSVVSSVVKTIIGIRSKVLGAFANAASMLVGIGRNIIDGLINGIRGQAGRVVSTLQNIVGDAINAAKRKLGIASPSKVFKQLGTFTMAGFLNGIKAESPKVYKQLTLFVDRIKRIKVRDAVRNSLETTAKKFTIKLDGLKRRLATVRESIKNAKERVADLIQARNEFARDVAQASFSGVGAFIQEDTNASSFLQSLKDRLKAVKKFAADLKTLAGRGLSADVIRQFASAGVEQAGGLVNSLTTASTKTISEINSTNKSLVGQSKALGTQLAGQMYDNGIRAAQGLVKGLQSQEKNILKLMDRLALQLVRTIKKQLGIKSPSKVFQGIGGYVVDGLVKGLENTNPVIRATDRLAAATVGGFDASLSASARGTAGGGVPNVYVTVNALDPRAAAPAVKKALDSYYKDNGRR